MAVHTLIAVVALTNLVAAWMTTHIHVSERALSSASQLYSSNIFERISLPSLHAGSFFPDWGYSCANQNDAGEAAHWPAFWDAAFTHLHEKHPPTYNNITRELEWTNEAIPLISFYLGMVSHGVADYIWHNLDNSGWGLVQALAHNAFNGSFARAHKAADFGGEFALAHSMDLNTMVQSKWHVPTGDLVEIYKSLGYEVSVFDLNRCMALGYSATQGIRVAGKYLFPHWAQESPLLIDMFYSYPHGGIQSMSRSVVSCWLFIIKNGFQGMKNLPLECAGGINGGFVSANQDKLQDLEGPEQFTFQRNEHVHHMQSIMDWAKEIRPTVTSFKNQTFEIKANTWNLRWNGLGRFSTWTLPAKSDEERPSKLTRLLSVLSEAVTEFYQISKSWVLQTNCHSIDHMQRVAKMNTFYTKNPHADLGESITSGNFSSSRILDLILAAPGYASQRGCVFVLSNMSYEELSLSEKLEVESMATVQICGPSDQGRFGTSMAVLDFNLDGVDDLVVSAPFAFSDTGAVYVFYGSADGGLARKCRNKTRGCKLTANVDSDIVIRGSLFGQINGMRGFGYVLTVGDVSGTGKLDLVVGSPYFGSWFSPNRGVVHSFQSSSYHRPTLIVNDALWSLSSPSGQNYEEFGASIGVIGDLLIVGSPGWKASYFENSHGMVQVFQILNGNAPVQVGSTAGEEPSTGFGRNFLVSLLGDDDESKEYLLASSPTENSSDARAKFLDLPGVATSFKSRGYGAGVVRVIDPTSLTSGSRSLSSVTLSTLKGSKSNARLGGSGMYMENGELWVAEALVDGESGRIYRISNDTIFQDPIISLHRPKHGGGGHRHDPELVSELFPRGLSCISGGKSGDRLGVAIHRMDFDDDDGSDLIVATGTGLVHLFW